MVLKMKMVGDWGKAKDILGKAEQLKNACDWATLQEAQQARRDIVKGITAQAPAGQAFTPLAAITLALRKAKGFRGKKILLVTAGLRNSITVKQIAKGKVWIGVLRTARGKDGRSLHNVARIQELGGVIVVRVTPRMRKWLMIQLRKVGFATREKGAGGRDKKGKFTKAKFVASGNGQLSKGVLVIKIPARPFISPVIEKIQKDPAGLRKRFAHRIAFKMGGALGTPD